MGGVGSARRRVEADGPGNSSSAEWPAGGRGLQAICEVGHPAAPHRVELDEGAVLVEDDEVEAGEARMKPRRGSGLR